MIHNKNRTLDLVVGAERSGKTYSVERRADHYAKFRGPVLVYNSGRATDFKDYDYIEILYPEDVAWAKFPGKKQSFARTKHTRRAGVTHFKWRGKTYHLKHFNQMFTRIGSASMKVKMFRIPDLSIEDQFFKACINYMSGTLIIMDDARPITKHGIKGSLITLLNKKNHGGQHAEWFRTEENLMGVDLIMIYHGLGRVSSEMFDYANHITMFKTNQAPGKNIDNPDVIPEIKRAYDYLREVGKAVPNYTSVRVYIKGPKANTGEIIPPTIVNKI